MYSHEVYEGPGEAYPYSLRGLTWQAAIDQARSELCALHPPWCAASDAEIQKHICADDCTIFTEPGSAVRLALCGTTTCPAPQPWPSPGAAAPDNMMILGLAGIAVVGVVAWAIASRGKKKVLVARIPR